MNSVRAQLASTGKRFVMTEELSASLVIFSSIQIHECYVQRWQQLIDLWLDLDYYYICALLSSKI